MHVCTACDVMCIFAVNLKASFDQKFSVTLKDSTGVFIFICLVNRQLLPCIFTSLLLSLLVVVVAELYL